MNHPIQMNLDQPQLFFQVDDYFTEELLEKHLTTHLESKGFPVGVYNVTSLSQDEFALIRSNTFGASDSAVLLNVAYSSKTVTMKSQDELMYEKINLIFDEEIGKKASVRKGKELESLIIDKVSNIIDGTVVKPKHMYINGQGLATNFDGVVLENASNNSQNISDNFIPVPMEIKVCTFFARSNYNWEKGIHENSLEINNKLKRNYEYDLLNKIPIEDHIIHASKLMGIPKYYYTQLQQQMLFLDSPHGYLAVLDDINWDLYFFKVPRDQFVIDALVTVSTDLYAKLSHKKGL